MIPLEIRTLEDTARITRTSVSQGQMVWRQWGTGIPLLLLHGSHGGWMHWLRNIPGLSMTHRLIVPDMPGCGDSDPVEALESPTAHAQALADGLRRQAEVPAGGVDMVAFSLGATIACHLSLIAPDLVRRLILVDAGGLGTPMHTPNLRPVRGLEGEAVRAVNRHNLGAMMFHNPARIDETAVDISIHCAKRFRTRVQNHVIPDKLLAVLRNVTVPLDVIWGSDDYIHPNPELNAQVVRAVDPQASLEIVADAGHWSMYEQPERFNGAALNLLARKRG